MNSKRLMAGLAAANPVSEPPTVPTAARIRETWPHEGTQAAEPAAGRTQTRRNLLPLAGSLAAALTVAAVVLLVGASRPQINVLASAYAATSPAPGIIEAVFQSTTRVDGRDETFRQQEWVDATTHQVRELNTKTTATTGSEVNDRVSNPGVVESWSNAYEPGVVRRELTTYTPRSTAWGFGGLQLEALGGTALFRDLYRAGQVRLVGRVVLNGKQLWKLRSASTTVDGRPHTELIVLLDPRTFLPTRQSLLNVSEPRRPEVLTTSQLISYRQLHAAASGNTIFNLTAQHPGTAPHTRAGHFPIFRRFHPKSIKSR
jgi:hypothetical protein